MNEECSRELQEGGGGDHDDLSDIAQEPEEPFVGTRSGEHGASLPTDDVFEILQNGRRRAVLRYLRSNEGRAELSDLAEHIAAAENDTTVELLSSKARKRVYIALYQCHLPKMDSLGVIEYDKNRGTIELLESASELERYLDSDDTVDDAGRPPVRLVAGFAAAAVTLVVAGALGLGPLSTVPPAGWTMVSVVAIVVIVGFQYRQ